MCIRDRAVSVEENQTATFTATATDVDGDTLTYTLTGVDAALFAIDAATGVVSFIEAPDFETSGDADGDNIYDVTVTASDGELSSSQNVAITVTDENEAPVITSAAAVSVEENGTAAFTATATDVDGDTLTYTLTGSDAALFAIDAATGEVSFIAAPDFETPGDADGDNVYDVTVTASDGELSEIQDVAITITDGNDAPVITSAMSFSVQENLTEVFTVSALDENDDILNYSLGGTDASRFSIDAVTGVVSFVDAPDFETPADSNGDNIYDVTITANDGELTTSQDVSISVLNVNEAPVILTPTIIEVAEGSRFITTFDIVDPEGDDFVLFRLGSADGQAFSFDRRTGNLFFSPPPEFNNPADANGDNIYEFTLNVQGSSSIIQTFQIVVVDVDVAPLITIPLIPGSAGEVIDETEDYSRSFSVSDDFDSELLTLSLEGDDAAFFEIIIDENDMQGGISARVVSIDRFDFENPLDADGDNNYVFNIVADDGVNRSERSLDVSIMDVRESVNRPFITTDFDDPIVVVEGQEFVIDIDAFDADGDAVFFRIFGPDRGDFTIDNFTGQLSFNAPAVFNGLGSSEDNFYTLTIRLDDRTFDEDGEPTFVFQDITIQVIETPDTRTVSEGVLVSNVSQIAELGLVYFSGDSINAEFEDQFVIQNVFEPAQVSLSEDINPNREGDIWTVQSIVDQLGALPTEPDPNSFFEDIYSTTDEDGLHLIADTNDFAADVWM